MADGVHTSLYHGATGAQREPRSDDRKTKNTAVQSAAQYSFCFTSDSVCLVCREWEYNVWVVMRG